MKYYIQNFCGTIFLSQHDFNGILFLFGNVPLQCSITPSKRSLLNQINDRILDAIYEPPSPLICRILYLGKIKLKSRLTDMIDLKAERLFYVLSKFHWNFKMIKLHSKKSPVETTEIPVRPYLTLFSG